MSSECSGQARSWTSRRETPSAHTLAAPASRAQVPRGWAGLGPEIRRPPGIGGRAGHPGGCRCLGKLMRDRGAAPVGRQADRLQTSLHRRSQTQPLFPEPRRPQPHSHSICSVSAQRDLGPRPALLSPAPAVGCAVASSPRCPLPGCLPHFPRASRGPALAPRDPRGAVRAERRRGRGLAQDAPGLAAGSKGWGQSRRKQRARNPAAVPARSLSLH
ncbi:unnamed protein product [Rangifer tarandus platyrhynchus]|uniref:Uncharacterized protein n=2 Tax=Rangifer tarandus platyrhynchus TaxID=3082113 RepID=A0ACB0F289_RANTA|nr:unnamed protein product [Rangifer tarandus platyrhynchus]CAI9707228.1 unnamed protein product [Rangifer tarandus platyrhynchus]